MFFNILVVLVTLIVASYHDLNKKTVPGYVLYPMIIIGVFSTLFTIAAVQDPFFKYLSLIIACFVVVIGAVANQKNLLGGADILLFVGIVLMTPVEFMSVQFFLTLFFFSCLTGVFFYIITKLLGKKDAENIKFVPCILIGYIVTIYGIGLVPF